ncbi:hypothetical protein [Nonomuraea endophytica]|uniref:Uncharacterized protein n=1 Tax=Nonomuraea endophytica TaxID=714136 RepID=A0A7W8EJ77_9ACTN|nr:hypothetical protein [Nonomuraea endophytica]MBB5081251.1 hypothetical protein [Nonomuraea endophytica]
MSMLRSSVQIVAERVRPVANAVAMWASAWASVMPVTAARLQDPHRLRGLALWWRLRWRMFLGRGEAVAVGEDHLRASHGACRRQRPYSAWLAAPEAGLSGSSDASAPS